MAASPQVSMVYSSEDIASRECNLHITPFLDGLAVTCHRCMPADLSRESFSFLLCSRGRRQGLGRHDPAMELNFQ